MMRTVIAACVLAGCGNIQGIGGGAPPLATYTVEASGTPAMPPHHLAAAVVWGMQWLPEPLCILPPDTATDPNAPAAIAAGCRDPFGFVPLLVGQSVDITAGVPAQIAFQSLPGSEVLVGDLTARVGYASVVVYDDVNDSNTLELARPNRLGVPTEGPGSEPGSTMLSDIVYGASFISMTAPDQRIAYREGAFDEAAAFYPRAGCGDPPPGFSVLAASGFDPAAAIAAAIMGKLPPEKDLSQCVQAEPPAQAITVPLQTPNPTLNEVACTERNADSSVRYREPPADAPDFTGRKTACVHIPNFGMGPPQQIELIVSGVVDQVSGGPPVDACVGLTHYILKGCGDDPNCGTPRWDHSQLPPSWWPCPRS